LLSSSVICETYFSETGKLSGVLKKKWIVVIYVSAKLAGNKAGDRILCHLVSKSAIGIFLELYHSI